MSAIEREQIVAAARRWIGTPYQHQASLLGVGCDCLGLVRGVWRETLGEEPEPAPPYTPDWAEARGKETLLEAAHRNFRAIGVADFREGDLLVFRLLDRLPAKHLGVASGAASMIHAHDGACVAEVAITPQWRKRIAAAFAFPGVTD